MRILFVTPILPVPMTGGRTRIFHLIRQLAGRHRVSVFSLIQPWEAAMLSSLDRYCERIELVPFDGFQRLGPWRNRLRGWSRLLFSQRPQYAYTFPVDSMREPLREILVTETYDVVVLEQLFLVELLDEIRGLPTVLVEQNVESDIARRAYLRASHPVHRLRDWLKWRKFLVFERRWVQRFPVCVAVSERDAALLREMSPATQVHVVPNGVDIGSFAAPSPDSRAMDSLLFFGTLSYEPNVDGLIWFCQEVLPRVRESSPGVGLEVVGLDPPQRVTELQRLPGVQITGFVPDIRPKLWSATMCVVPLHVGGGTRLKILEALAAGCPVISTTVGVEGLALVDGEHLLLADTAEEFAHGILALLKSDRLRQRLADAGRQAVAQRYDWQQITLQLEAACTEAIQHHTHA